MPLPKPTEGEPLEEFLPRCMSSEEANAEFNDDAQRLAACSTIYANNTVSPKSTDELTAPIVYKDTAKRVVYGPVLVPDSPDSDGDTVTAEKIEAVAHRFLEEYRLMEHMHTLKSVARPVESFIAPIDLTLGDATIPKGSWIVGAKIQDEGAWGEVLSGKLTGFSIVAVPTGATKSEAVAKKLTLRDIEASGQDWEVIAIGLVDRPAVPLAKWTAVKRQEEDKPNWLQKLLIPSSKAKETESTKEDEVTPEEIKELIAASVGAAIGDALKPITEQIATLSAPTTDKDDGKSTETAGITEEQLEEALQKSFEAGAGSLLVKMEEYLESKPKISAKSLAESLRGQDGHSTSKQAVNTRDPWGRRIEEESKS